MVAKPKQRTLRVAGRSKNVKKIKSARTSVPTKKKENPCILSFGAYRFNKQTGLSQLNRIFDAVYVINLERRRDKMDLLDFRLQELKINYFLVKAIDGHAQPHLQHYRNLKRKYGHRPFFTINSPGAYGLVLTYEYLLEQAVQDKREKILILEDDINFHKNFNQLLSQARINFKNQDLIWLGANQPRWEKDQLKIIQEFDKKIINSNQSKITSYPVSRRIHTYGAFAIGLNKKAIRTLHSYYREGGPRRHSIDYQIYHLIEKDARSFSGSVLYPNLIIPDVSTSDNKPARDQIEYAKVCHWQMEQYCYLPLHIYTDLRTKMLAHLKDQGISVRQLFFYSPPQLSIEEATELLELSGESKGESKSESKGESKSESEGESKGESKENDWWLQIVQEFLDPNQTGQLAKRLLYQWLEGIDNSIVFVVPSYNNQEVYQKNLDSIFEQTYPHVRVIYVNDASVDQTLALVTKYLDDHNYWQRIHLINQVRNQKQGCGRWMAFHLCDDDEICCLVDGDDWLFNDQVAKILNQRYLDYDLMASYGSFHEWYRDKQKNGRRGTGDFPKKIVKSKSYRNYRWISQHLRTARAGLFKRIALSDLLDHHQGGQFLRMSTDVAEMMPILEMANQAHRNLKESLYVYNKGNSVRYNSSYYRLKEKGNQENLDYHAQVHDQIETQKPYPTVLPKQLIPVSSPLQLNLVLIGSQEVDEKQMIRSWCQSSVWSEHHQWTSLEFVNIFKSDSWDDFFKGGDGEKSNLGKNTYWTIVLTNEIKEEFPEHLELMIRYLQMTQGALFSLDQINGADSTINLTHQGAEIPIIGCLTGVPRNKSFQLTGPRGVWQTSFLSDWKPTEFPKAIKRKKKIILFSPKLYHLGGAVGTG